MTTPSWVSDSIFYQIFPERFSNGDKSNDPIDTMPWNSKPTRDNFFGGDIQGIVNNLDYLVDLGVNALYLTPIFKAKSNHKYDVCDYLLVDPAFGTNETLRKLVSSAHKRGMRVILDAVFNHCGFGFWAFQDVEKRGYQSQFLDWFHVDSYPITTNPPNYQTAGGAWYLPKLNTNSAEVRKYLYKVASYWMEKYDIDGWRLDVPWKVPKEFWQTFREKVKLLNPNAYILGEFWRDFNPWVKGDTCDGVMNYALRDYLLDYCVHRTQDAEDFSYYVNRQKEDFGKALTTSLNIAGSHDTPRILTVCNNDSKLLSIIYTFLFTYIGAPCIFYGDELGIKGKNDPDCRQPMTWNREEWNEEIRSHIVKLIKLRKNHAALRSGRFEILKVLNETLVFRRANSRESILVVINPADSRRLDFRIKSGVGKSSKRKIWKDYLSDRVCFEENGEIIISVLKEKSAMILLGE